MYCSHCCFYNEDGAVAVCGQCGKELVQKLSLEERGKINQSRKASVKAANGAGITVDVGDDVGEDEHEYAGAGVRSIALQIDSLIMCMMSIFIWVVQIAICDVIPGEWNPNSFAANCLYLVVMLVISWLYYALMESSSLQGTVGKFIMKLKVTDLNCERLHFRQASIRYLAHMICIATFGLGYLMILFSERKQGMHDKIAGTYVERYRTV